MKYLGIFLVLAVQVLAVQVLAAQDLDSVYVLPQATISSTPSAVLFHFDSTRLANHGQQTLTEVLQDVPQLLVRNYGPGSLGTLSVMGGTSAHTAIKWQGISIRNPMLGQNDLSLLPTQLFDKVSIDFKGGSALNGNAQLNGTIMLSSAVGEIGRTSVGFESGSWSRWGGQIVHANRVGSRVRMRTQLYGLTSTNDFAYRIGNERIQQSNASITNVGVYHVSQMQRTNGSNFSLAFWWQRNDQQIPPVTTQRSSLAAQETSTTRIALNFNPKKVGEPPLLTLGFIRENLNYQDPTANIFSEHLYHTTSVAFKKTMLRTERHILTGGVEDRFSWVDTENYADKNQSENQLEAFLAWSLLGKSSRLQVAVRQGMADDRLMPTTISANFRHEIASTFTITGSVSRDVRYVTLNERFWQPGGNPELEEEVSFAQSISASFTPIRSESWMRIKANIFNRQTSNWILWTPLEGQLYWSPQNLSQVWSRGGSIEISYAASLGKIRAIQRGSLAIIHSTNERSIVQPRIEAGQQLFYTPKQKINFSTNWNLGDFGLTYRHTYTGGYLGVLDELSSFHLGQLDLALKQIRISRYSVRAWMLLDNVWNTDYRMIERRPMPLRSVRFGVHLDI